MEKQLREPENWQDFETLCKKLWGEFWRCPEIKKHGTIGQPQKGVDLYGIPEDELKLKDDKKYYGIQCKKKDKKKNNKISESEIDEEIEEAIKFKPPLKKYYIATTASKDVTIEEYVREKNLESINKGLFQIEIFFWEDIVSLIDGNRSTHDWYVKNKGYKTNYKIEFTFDDGSKEITLKPIFKKIITEYKIKPKPTQLELNQKEIIKNIYGIDYDLLVKQANQPSFYQNLQILKNMNFNPLSPPPRNYSYVYFEFIIKNLGNTPLEDYKLYLNFEGEYRDLGVCSKGEWYSTKAYKYNSKMESENKAVLIPFDKILVPDDENEFDSFYLNPNHDSNKIIINWKFLSRDFNDEGSLNILIEPELKEENQILFTENEAEVRVNEYIEDYKEERK